MKNQFFISIITLALIVSSCEYSITTAQIENSRMCSSLTGELCGANRSVFSTDEELIFISCNLNNAPDNTIVTFSWKYIGEVDTIIIDEVSVNSSEIGVNLNLSSNLSRPYNGWPKGNYEVEIIIEDSQRDPVLHKFEVR